MSFTFVRVLPRDLFNDSKILKCIGQLCLHIEDCKEPYGIGYEYNELPFSIHQTFCGHLFIANIIFKVRNKPLLFKTVYNNKRPYPLLCEYNNIEYTVFTDKGEYEKEFIDFINSL